MKRTKIVATIGPASASSEMLTRLIETGLDVVRVNSSHGTPEVRAEWMKLVRDTSARLGRDFDGLGLAKPGRLHDLDRDARGLRAALVLHAGVVARNIGRACSGARLPGRRHVVEARRRHRDVSADASRGASSRPASSTVRFVPKSASCVTRRPG